MRRGHRREGWGRWQEKSEGGDGEEGKRRRCWLRGDTPEPALTPDLRAQTDTDTDTHVWASYTLPVTLYACFLNTESCKKDIICAWIWYIYDWLNYNIFKELSLTSDHFICYSLKNMKPCGAVEQEWRRWKQCIFPPEISIGDFKRLLMFLCS